MTRPQPYQCPDVRVIHLNLLPEIISLPDVDADPDDAEAVIYKPLSRATISELNAHLVLLATEITEATARFRQLKRLSDVALAQGAGADTRVGSLFAGREG